MDRPDFIEELLLEAEQADLEKRISMDRLRADQLLFAVAELESQMFEVNELVDKETKLLEGYRSNELSRLEKKRSWLVFNLDGFMRSTGQKTVRLPHGELRLRKSKDRIVVVALDKFLEIGKRLGLVRTVPESVSPDIQAVLNRIKTTGEIPQGIEFIPGEAKFSYNTNGGNDAEREAES
ncbi:MAG TPA: host-nuclease inhibitor Gam family protein [Bacteroidota bacterium]|nr:host-nuclease inhibitor Gam family protein [Bacteroidota bacterium]